MARQLEKVRKGQNENQREEERQRYKLKVNEIGDGHTGTDIKGKEETERDMGSLGIWEQNDKKRDRKKK